MNETSIFIDPFFKQLMLHLYAYLGAVTLYVLNKQQQKQPLSLFSALNVDMGKAPFFVVLLDMVFSCLLGTFGVVALTSPDTAAQALAAGLGMTGLLSVYTKETNREDKKNE